MKTLFGLTCDCLLRRTPQAQKFPKLHALLLTPMYGSHDRPFVAGYDRHGTTIEHTPFPPLASDQYLEVTSPIAIPIPEIGEPYDLMVMHPKTNKMKSGHWDAMATYLCSEGYAAARRAALHDGLDGYHIARFIARTAPEYANNGNSEFNVRRHRAEIEEMGLIAAALEKAHPDFARGLTPTVKAAPVEIGN